MASQVTSLLREFSHTGISAFLRPPDALSKAFWIYGPTTGIFPAKLPMVAKKSPKSTNIPYSSTRNPTNGHRKTMRIIPPAKAAVPLSFCRRAKKIAVFCKPMMRVRPSRKSICIHFMVRIALQREKGSTYVSHCKHRSIEEHDHSPKQEEAP